MVDLPDEQPIDGISDGVAVLRGLPVGKVKLLRSHCADQAVDIEPEAAVALEGGDRSGDDLADRAPL